jgi:hypothetical protein
MLLNNIFKQLTIIKYDLKFIKLEMKRNPSWILY